MRSRALWRVLPYAKPYRKGLIFTAFVALADLAAASMIPLVTKSVIDGPLRDGNRSAILPLALLALGLGATETFARFLRRNVAGRISIDMEVTIRNDLYAHLQRLHVGFHDNWRSGQLLSRAIYDINSIRRFIGFGMVFFVVNVLTFVLVIFLLFRLHALLAIVTAVALLPIIALVRGFEHKYRKVVRRVQDQQGDVATTVEEATTGIRIIKAFGRGPQISDRFRTEAEMLYGSSVEQADLRASFWPMLGLIPSLAQAGILLGGGFAVANGSLTIGGLVAFISYLIMLDWPVKALGWILAMGEEASTAAERLYEVLDETPSIADRPGSVPLAEAEGRVRFENVSFRYGTGPWILRDVNLEVEPGETMAIVGSTGCGKTTLVSLVARLYDVTEGAVTLDGHDVRSITLSSLRSHIGTAFEDPILFSASVRENLLIGKPDATEEDMTRALEVAQAEFVYELPWKLDTRVGEQGYSLSGGQRQRLALARAIIGAPRVLVLDDPLSSLDVHTEHLVEEALERILKGATALLVVHRPSTLALADRVAFLDGGTIVAVGTHTELMESHPAYRAILSQEAEEIVS